MFVAVCLSAIALVASLVHGDHHSHGNQPPPVVPLFRHHLGRIPAGQLFTSQVQPALFNWTFGQPEQFEYRVSLAGLPDLPSWMRYMYSAEYGSGYLYGTPPARLIGTAVHLDLVALDTLSYETRLVQITYAVVARKVNGASEAGAEQPVQAVQMRIDNLNWVQLMDPGRVENLKNIFRHDLWPESNEDLHVAFMDSAVSMGGRVPLRPQEKEGVIIHLASSRPLSVRLLDLQQEIRPLHKLTSCSYKRTSVQTVFEAAGFKIDWCAFRIRDHLHGSSGSSSSSSLHLDATSSSSSAEQQQQLPSPAPPPSATVFHQRPVGRDPLTGAAIPYQTTPIARDAAPQRNYIDELAWAMCVPLAIFTLLVAVLTMIVCLHDGKVAGGGELVAAAAGGCGASGPVQMVQYGPGGTTTTTTTATLMPPVPPQHLHLHLDDGQSLRSQSPGASLLAPQRAAQPLAAASAAGLLLLGNSTLRPRPPPYKPPSAASYLHGQPKGAGMIASVAAEEAAANGAVAAMSQSASSRVLYC